MVFHFYFLHLKQEEGNSSKKFNFLLEFGNQPKKTISNMNLIQKREFKQKEEQKLKLKKKNTVPNEEKATHRNLKKRKKKKFLNQF
jgi:hypothetical protein